MTADPSFKFFTDSISYKTITAEDGEEEHFIEGYISTSDLDRVGDVVSRKALKDMVEQIKTKNVKLDVEHEAWLKSPNIVPIGRIIDARLDAKGIFVKAVLNKHSSRFKEIWNSIKSGFIDAFSIAYKAVKAAKKEISGKTVRILDQVELLNVALTGNPANPECRIAAVLTKSLTQLNEVESMTEQEVHVQSANDAAPAPESVQAAVAAVVPPQPSAAAPAASGEAIDVKSMLLNVDQLKTEIAELKNLREKDNAEVKALTDKLKAAEEALSKPQMKHKAEEAPRAEPVVAKTPLQMIR